MKAFRGIPRELTVGIGEGPRPVSLLILGDNGSGKSSIVDAVQFALQCEVQGLRGTETIQAGRSRQVPGLPRTSVRLSSSEEVTRGVVADESGRSSVLPDDVPVEAFARTPLVLRRADILRFWETASAERQLVFVRYFRPGQRRGAVAPEHAGRIRRDRDLARDDADRAVARLSRTMGLSTAEIPTDAGFENWVGDLDPDRNTPPVMTAIGLVRTARTRLARASEDVLALETQLSGGAGAEVHAALEGASAFVTSAFSKISPAAPVAEVEVRLGHPGELTLDVQLVLANGERAEPSHVLSEANRDLLALLIFVSIARSASSLLGQARVIILDDVFQSADGPVRVAAMDQLLELMPEWQFVMTVHDRLWREQLVDLFRRHGLPLHSHEIVRWSPAEGPVLRESSQAVTERLSSALSTGDPVAIAAHAGLQLEQVCGPLSWILPITLTRRRDDRYTLGDLWPPIHKRLKRTTLLGPAGEIDRYIHLRNLLGAHHNEWAQGASLAESERLAGAVLELVHSVICGSCGRWIEATPERDTWSCRCGDTRVEPRVKAG